MVALLRRPRATEFGVAKVFRPYRDVRFAKDKTPYKTAQGAFVEVGPATGWYVEVSARGVRTGAGFYDATGPRIAAIREAIDDDRTGHGARSRCSRSSRATAGGSAGTSSRQHPAATTSTIRGSSCCGTSR